MTNILDAVYNISQLKSLEINDITFGNNRANNVGEGLEEFVKDAFANTLNIEDKKTRIAEYSKIFSYEGSKRTPPDLMLRGGDAIEVKKIEVISSELQLNSSHPKNKLLVSSSLINKHCRECENWTEKDFIYVIGHVPKNTKSLSSIWLIYGDLYAADENVYISLKDSLTDSIQKTPNVDFSPTNEIGRVNGIDPLKISNLRIRGMWLLQQPYKVFDYIHDYDEGMNFQCFALISENKYSSFPKASKDKIENNNAIEVIDVDVQNPNNPVSMIKAKLIKYSM